MHNNLAQICRALFYVEHARHIVLKVCFNPNYQSSSSKYFISLLTFGYNIVLYPLLYKRMGNINLNCGKKQLTAISRDMFISVFIVFIFNSLGIFSQLAWGVLKGFVSYKTCIVAAFSFTIFSVICTAAQKVNEADKFAKYTNSLILQKISAMGRMIQVWH